MNNITRLEVKELKKLLKVAHKRKSNILMKLANDSISNPEELNYTELSIKNMDKIVYKFYKTTNNKLFEDFPTKFDNMLITLAMEDQPACLTVNYKDAITNKNKKINICAFYIMSLDDNKKICFVHYGEVFNGKLRYKVDEVVYKTEGDNIYAHGDANSFSSQIISYSFSLMSLINRYCDLNEEKVKTLSKEELNEDINKYFCKYVEDDINMIEESKDDEMDLSDALSLLSHN